MAAEGNLTDNLTKKFQEGVLKIKDGTTPTPKEITVKLEEGDFNTTLIKPHTVHKDRGGFHHRRKSKVGDLPTVSFGITYSSFYASTTDVPSPYEALTGKGQCATGWTSKRDGQDDVYCVDLELTINDPLTSATEVLTFPSFALTEIGFQEGEEANKLSFTGDYVPADDSFGGPTISGSAGG